MAKPDPSKEEADAEQRPGATLLRFKKLTNHLFGKSLPPKDGAPRESEDATHGRSG
jgi:hypothetical protein